MPILDIVLVSATTLLVLAAIWLWNLGTTTTARLALKTAVVPSPDISSSFAGKRRDLSNPQLRYLRLLGSTAGAVFALLILTVFVSSFSPELSNPILGLPIVPFLLVAVAVIILVIFLSQRRPVSVAKNVRYKREFDRLLKRGDEMEMIVSIPAPEEAEEPQPEKRRTTTDRIQFSGLANLPSRVYVGRSEGISVLLQSEGPSAALLGKTLSVRESDDGMSISVEVPDEMRAGASLEIELLASGAKIEGRRAQRVPLERHFLQYHWNCLFLTPGRQTLTMVFRVVQDDDAIGLGALHHRIKVGQLDHISPEQLAAISFASGLAGLVTLTIYLVQLLF